MTIKELQQKMNDLSIDINNILRKSNYNDYDDLSALDDYESIKENPDTLQLFDEYKSLLYKLQDVAYTVEWLNKPIKEVGYLVKQSNDRYSLNGIELTSGYGLEWLCEDDDFYYNYEKDSCCPYWRAGRIEHNGKDYYIVGCKVEDITTVKVRMR